MRRYAIVNNDTVVGVVNWDGAEARPYGAADLRGPLPEGQGLETWGGRNVEELEAAIAQLGSQAATPPIGVSGASPLASTAPHDRPPSLFLPRKGGGKGDGRPGRLKKAGPHRSSSKAQT